MPIETYKENIIQINRFNVFLNIIIDGIDLFKQIIHER